MLDSIPLKRTEDIHYTKASTIIRVQEGLEKKEDVIEILKSNDIDLKQFKQVNFENELNIIINKIFKIWENKVKTNPCEIDEEILNQII